MLTYGSYLHETRYCESNKCLVTLMTIYTTVSYPYAYREKLAFIS